MKERNLEKNLIKLLKCFYQHQRRMVKYYHSKSMLDKLLNTLVQDNSESLRKNSLFHITSELEQKKH